MGSKTLVMLVGAPSVGKMTVGRALSRRTGLPLFHNHLSIEAVRPVFDFGTAQFNRLVGRCAGASSGRPRRASSRG